MSRIYEALQILDAARSKSGAADWHSLGAMEMPEQRQSSRRESAMPLTVYGRAPNGSPFYQEAQSVSGNADGGLIVLCAPVREGQDLLLINDRTSVEQMCRVVHVRGQDAETSEVGVAFSSPNPDFWQALEFPFNLPEKHWDNDF